mmetsp:Transcript_5198/g.12346  ORF Transcript_5198/g.12346 Transcript_5198/m.12346 type:complete len:105 (+) Transcript_5198:502-816(+)
MQTRLASHTRPLCNFRSSDTLRPQDDGRAAAGPDSVPHQEEEETATSHPTVLAPSFDAEAGSVAGGTGVVRVVAQFLSDAAQYSYVRKLCVTASSFALSPSAVE